MSAVSGKSDTVAQAGQDLRLRMCELQEHQRWVHHAVDVARKQIITTSQDRPITPLQRARQFAQLGYGLNPTVFGGVSYQLRPSQPYQAAPLAWLEAMAPSYYAAAGDVIYWEPPSSFDPRTDVLGMSFHIGELPATQAFLATVSLAGNSFADSTGYAQLQTDEQASGWLTVDVPFESAFASHTVDMLITYIVPIEASIGVQVLSGIQLLQFHAFSLRSAPLENAPPESV